MEPAPTWSAGCAVLSCSRQTRICSGAHPALVWRQSRQVGPAADGNTQMNRHSAFADAVSALDEGGLRAPPPDRRRAVLPREARLRHPRRGRRPLPYRPRPPLLPRGLALQGREDRRRGPALALPRLRAQVHLAHRHGAGRVQIRHGDLAPLHQPHAVQRAPRRHGREAGHNPPDGMGVAPPRDGRRRRPSGPRRPARPGLD